MNFLHGPNFYVVETHRDIKFISHPCLMPLIPTKGRKEESQDLIRGAYILFYHCNRGRNVAILYAFLTLNRFKYWCWRNFQ